jgi:hypothetical protein
VAISTLALISLAAGPAFTALADTETASEGELRDFCADRPGKATPACILDEGHLQVETGVADATFQRGRDGHDDSYLLGQTELRFGLDGRTELTATWTPLSIDHPRADPNRSGVGDLLFGFRTALTDPDAEGNAVSLEALASAPTATNDQGAGGWEGSLRLPVSLGPVNGFAVGLTPEVDDRRDEEGGGMHAAVSGAASVSHDVAGASVAVELWGERDDDPAGHVNSASFDLSVAWMDGENLQFDAGANAGLTHATPDLEVYVGVARRF